MDALLSTIRQDKAGRLFLPYMHQPGCGIWIGDSSDYYRQIFSHRDEGGGWRHFDVGGIGSMIDRGSAGDFEQIEVNLLPHQVAHVAKNQGIEQRGLARLTGAQLRRPGILVLLPNRTSIVVDGNHRYVRRAQLGFASMRFWQVTEAQAKPWLLDIPSPVAGLLLAPHLDEGP